MAQSIKLVSCNNNNKDTTIYLLVSLSSFDLCFLFNYFISSIFSNLLETSFHFCFFFCLQSPLYPLLYINPHAYFIAFNSTLLAIEKTGNFKYQSTRQSLFLSPSIIVIYNIIMYK